MWSSPKGIHAPILLSVSGVATGHKAKVHYGLLSGCGIIDPWVGGLYSAHPTKKALVLLKGPEGWISACIATEETGAQAPPQGSAALEWSSTWFALFGNSV